MDNPDTLEYPTPYEQANDSEDVYVGRIRSQQIQGDSWVSLWVVADNVYGKGLFHIRYLQQPTAKPMNLLEFVVNVFFQHKHPQSH